MGDARDTSKAPDAFRTISEVAEDLDLPQHVLRFWETRFAQIRPVKRGGGRRFYRPEDIDLLRGIRHLLYSDGYTIKGVQKILKEHGVRHVQDLGVEHDVAVMRSARAKESHDGVTFGGLLGLLPRRKPRPSADDELAGMEELPLPFPDADADLETGHDAPPPEIPLRQRPAPAQRSRPAGGDRPGIGERAGEQEREQGREPRIDPSFAPPRGPGRGEPRRAAPERPSEPPRQRPTRGPAARIAAPGPPREAGADAPAFDDPLLPFFDEAPLAPPALSEPLDARIRRLKGDIAAEAEGRRGRRRPEDARHDSSRARPEGPSRDGFPEQEYEPGLYDLPLDGAPEAEPPGGMRRARPGALPDLPAARRRPAPAGPPMDDPRDDPRRGRRSWDDLEAEEGLSHGDADFDRPPPREPRRADDRMRPEPRGRDWEPESAPYRDEDDAAGPSRRSGRGPRAPYLDEHPHGADAFRPGLSHPEPWARRAPPEQRHGGERIVSGSDEVRDRHGSAGIPGAPIMKDDEEARWPERAPERPRRAVPRFGPFAGPPEEIEPPAPGHPPHPGPSHAGPAGPGSSSGPQAPVVGWPRRAADWRGDDPFDAGADEIQRRPVPPEPLRHGPPEQYLPPHLRSEPRITGQPPGAAPVLSRADVHRLQAALYELTECRRLMGEAMGREKGAGGGETMARDDAAPL